MRDDGQVSVLADSVLLGRDAPLGDLIAVLDNPRDGSGVLIEGEAGIGKSALVAAAVAAAKPPRILTVTGVEAERHLPYAGLHQLLFPIRAGIEHLLAAQADALRTALGLAEVGEPGPHRVGLAALTLLADAAADQPLVIVAEDAQWLDRPTAEALAFVARRIGSEPVVLVVTARDGAASPLRDAGLPVVRLPRLPDEVAARLLGLLAPELPPELRARVLAESAGNPLALTELPTAIGAIGTIGAIGGLDGPRPVLELSDRLERAFTARTTALPPDCRTALLVAALNESGSIAEILAATHVLLGAAPGPEVFTPAVTAGLVLPDPTEVRFRHPLMRSAIPASAAPDELRAAHRALAEVLTDHPDRRAWHRAGATTEPDDEVATELERAAERARHRAGAAAGLAAMEQAAKLSAHPGHRADRLLRAAELAVEAGRRDTAERLVLEARTLELSDRQQATARWLLSGFDDGIRESASRVTELADLAASIAGDGQVEPAMRILWGAAMRCFWSEPGPHARRSLLTVLDRLPGQAGDPRPIAVNAYVAPFERGAQVLDELRALAATTGADPEIYRYLGSASLQIGAFDIAARFSAASVPGLRALGQFGVLPRALAVEAWCWARLGDLAAATSAAAEAAELARESSQPFLYGLARAVEAEVAALRGDVDTAARLADEAERVGLASGARPVLATVVLARGIAGFSAGRYQEAFAELSRLLNPADPAYQIALSACCVAELAEAAVRAGQTEAMRRIVADLEPIAASAPAPALHIGLRYARAVLAPSERAEELFEEALRADLAEWPLERGRLLLAFGEWLRRRRRVVESRAQLRAARDTFDALGLLAWSERARRELRTAGETSPNRDPHARERLTAHELSIARLAAEGLTNREIGQRLYLSHRTVGTHLHRIFPKLGVSSRAELGRVLLGPDEAPSA